MDFTHSYTEYMPAAVQARYEFAETRNACAILSVTNPQAFQQIVDVLQRFKLLTSDLLHPGGQESELAARTNAMLRQLGWREARVDTRIELTLQRTPLRAAGESSLAPVITQTVSEGYKVDNFFGRVALDVEWNAKDGNLDRDIGAYRALYDAALIDVGVLITRTLALRELGRTLARAAGMSDREAKRILGTTTTTNDEKLRPRLGRGDGGGCPILAVFICDRTHAED